MPSSKPQIAKVASPKCVAGEETYRYWAFLSYSHQDGRWARWLHRQLETARIDKDLIGRDTSRGAVPRSLRPIFLDRQDFAAGPQLGDQTSAALEASRALIVVCSPAAAKSSYVNEEVHLFKTNRRGRPIIPFIVGGEPGTTDQNPFPRSLEFQVGSDGQISEEVEEVLGADARKDRDGKALALAKVVAGLLGLDTDEIFRRAKRHSARRRLFLSVTVCCFAALILASTYFARETSQKGQSLAEIEAIVTQFSFVSAVNAQDALARRSLTEAIQVIADGAKTDLRYKEALDLLKAGNSAKAEPLLQTVADEKAARLQRDRAEAATAYRHLGALAGIAAPERSRIAYSKALELMPDDPDALYWYGLLHLLAGHIEKATVALKHLQALAEQYGWEASLFRAHLRLGEIALLRGDVRGGLQHHSSAAAISTRVLLTNPRDEVWRRDHAVCLEKLGDLKSVQRRLASALADYGAAFELRQALLAEAPDHPELMREVAISHDKLGIVYGERGDITLSRTAFAIAYDIRRKLVKKDPNNATWQRDLGASLERNGDVKASASQHDAALDDYRASFAIRKLLVVRDPASYEALRDLSIAYNKLGDADRDRGQFQSALQLYRSALEIRERLVSIDPSNRQRQVDLALSLARVANATANLGDKTEALRIYTVGREGLVQAVQTTENWVWQGYMREFDGAIARLQN